MVGSRRSKENQGEQRVQEAWRKGSFTKKAVRSDKCCGEIMKEEEDERARGPSKRKTAH